jgi:hypothetical protein
MHTDLWFNEPEGNDHYEDVGIDKRIILKCILKEWDENMWTGYIMLRIGTNGGLFWTE